MTNYDEAMDRLQDEVAYYLHMQDQILRLFPPLKVAHAGVTRQVSEPTVLDATMRLHKSTASGELEMLLQTDAEQLKDFLLAVIGPIQDQQRLHVFEIMSQTSDAVGHTVKRNDGDAWEAYLDALQRVEMTFDDEGRPHYQIVWNSQTDERLLKVPPTEEQSKRAEQIFESKRNSYFAEKRHRRLF
jgi:hypothetical protein